MIDSFEPGKDYRLYYPSYCLVGSVPDFQPRECHVRKIRDLVTDPLTVEAFLRRPLLRRSRWILQIRDVKIPQSFRQFYVNSTAQHWRNAPLRLGWYDPTAIHSRPVEILPIVCPNTVPSRLALARSLLPWRDRARDDGLVIRVFCDDLTVVRRAG